MNSNSRTHNASIACASKKRNPNQNSQRACGDAEARTTAFSRKIKQVTALFGPEFATGIAVAAGVISRATFDDHDFGLPRMVGDDLDIAVKTCQIL